MNSNNLTLPLRCALLLCCCAVSCLRAQDLVPTPTLASKLSDTIQQLPSVTQADTVAYRPPLVLPRIPASFRNTAPNRLTDAFRLDSLFARLRSVATGRATDTLRIVHIGDSHVRGHIFPQTTGRALQEQFGALTYTDCGVNGATCLTFTDTLRIRKLAELKPQLVILSFGTNESHNRGYTSSTHYRQMDELVQLIGAKLPGIPLLLTTPPGSYERIGARRRRAHFRINPRTASAAETIKRYGKTNGLAVWDLYAIAGGSKSACHNWTKAQLLRNDHIHYTAEGYALQGALLHEALTKAYDEYITR